MEPPGGRGQRADRTKGWGLWRWFAAAATSLAALVLLAVALGGAYVPRKNGARDLRAKRQRIVALMTSATAVEPARLEDNLDCVTRAVFRAGLTIAEVAALREACAAALADGVITSREAEGIDSAASVLCQRAGGRERP